MAFDGALDFAIKGGQLQACFCLVMVIPNLDHTFQALCLLQKGLYNHYYSIFYLLHLLSCGQAGALFATISVHSNFFEAGSYFIGLLCVGR